EQPPGPNMVTVQQGVRTNDIEDVGDDTHFTFLEMLGNFSVGEYFKRQAIEYTWDFLVNRLGMPTERWWAVTYPGDEEARDAWLSVGVPSGRISATVDNFWGPPGGVFGPCGPNSEIHFDRGTQYGDCGPEQEGCPRFVEVWNDVFMDRYQEESGEQRPLPWRNIDTGMGFERLVAVVQGVESAYDTDLFQPIIRSVAELSGVTYGKDAATDRSFRIIADHSRAAAFIIAAGVMPSSEKRGYVLRRLIRRAALRGRMLGIDRPFLTTPVEVVIQIMSGYHAALAERRAHILTVIAAEEERFVQTLSRGLTIFDEIAARAGADGNRISGADVFLLHDTYGFPLELTRELAGERSLIIDEEGYEQASREQRIRARGHAARGGIGTTPETFVEIARQVSPTVFTGYDELRRMTTVAAIIVGGQLVDRLDEELAEGEMILSATPFYAESGGQVGDTGTIRSDSGAASVDNTFRPYASLIAHHVRIDKGTITVGDVVEAEVDAVRRLHILPHHSGTHLLHKALQEVLGPGATQAGSLVAPDRLRFDFQWPRPLTEDELRDVQERVNAAIWANLPVQREVMTYDVALDRGAMALFGEKYGDLVRVVSMGDWSKELCGGTHVNATGDIGSLIVTREESVSSGVRRIEAVAGAAAYAYTQDLRERLEQVAQALESRPDTVVQRAEHLLSQVRDQERRIAALTQQLALRDAETLLASARVVDNMTVVASRIQADSTAYLEATTDAVKSRLQCGIVVLASVIEGNPQFTAAVTRNLTEQGFQARAILQVAAKHVGGGGGGNAEFAKGGGRDASKVDEALRAAVDLIERRVGVS
ncbi:MAG: alanine--tRNA ligase, partial [Chloroflexota bacterium]